MKRIIDFHGHLGDIFLGKNVSFKTNLPKPQSFHDHFYENGQSGFTFNVAGKSAEALQTRIQQGQRRTQHGTLENILADLSEAEAAYMVLLPVFPQTSFEEYRAACFLDKRLLTFTSADYALNEEEMLAKLRQDIVLGAKGLKVHAILQNVPLNDERTCKAVEVFGEAGLPIYVHVGESYYYTLEQKNYHCPAEYGRLESFLELVERYPNYDFIAAHCANRYAEELANGVKERKHIYTDTTFCSAERIAKSVELLGAEQILFGTDYPFTTLGDSLPVVYQALGSDAKVLDCVLYQNAARLLHL